MRSLRHALVGISALLAVAVPVQPRYVTVAQDLVGACPDEPGWHRLTAPETRIPNSSEFGISTVRGSWQSAGGLYAAGFFDAHKSVDCGKSWQPLRLFSPGFPNPRGLLWAIALSVGPADYIYISSELAMAVSPDGGATWVRDVMGGGGVFDVAAQPTNGLAAYALWESKNVLNPETRWYNATLNRTDDGGRSWRHILLPFNPRSVSIDPVDSESVFVVADGALWRVTWPDPQRHLVVGADAWGETHPEGPWISFGMSADGSRFWLVERHTGRVRVSFDRGATWRDVVLPPGPSFLTRPVVSPFDPNRWFMVTGGELWTIRIDDSAIEGHHGASRAPAQVPAAAR